MDLMYEEGDTQISITWNDQDQKRVEEDYCEGCKTKELRLMIGGLVEKLVGVKEIKPVVIERPVVGVKKVFTDESVVQKIEKDKTKGLFVTVGKQGRILTSRDGNSWTERTSGSSESLRGVTYGNGLFVIVSYSGTILTSSDGTSWTKRYSGTTSKHYGVTYGNGLFVTVGRRILTSSDGITWTKRDSGTSGYLRGVTYGNELFVTVGKSGLILTSSDGTSWYTQRDRRYSGKSNILYGVTYSQ
jgi:hypothetical protein